MNNFAYLEEIIRNRRTTKPPLMNGQLIPEEQLLQILDLANWAPTHGLTEPWRFVVYAGEKVKDFCREHAELYRAHIAPEKFTELKYEQLTHMGDQASHVVIAIMRRGHLPNIPVLEEIAAASCAVQNVLLGATALGIASYWGSGGMAYSPAMKTHLGLAEEDLVLGLLYLGYSDRSAAGRRNSTIHTKVTFVN